MLRMSLSARRKTARSLASALAMAGVTVIGTASLSAPAFAQRGSPEAPRLTKDFQAVYQPVADAVNVAGDYAAAKAQVPALLAAIKSEYDRFHAGNIILQLGAKSSDRALQKQGLELMLASGQASPADVGLFRYYLAGFVYDAQDYDTARRELQAAIAAGYAGNFAEKQDPWGLIAESYFKQGRFQDGFEFLKKTIAERGAAGQEVREIWFERPLALAYEQKLTDDAVAWGALLVAQNPTRENWVKALQVINSLNPAADPQLRLDLLRLMALTNSLSDRREFEGYIEAADPRIMANEVGRVLDAGVQAGVFTASDPYYADVKRVVDDRVAADRADAPALAAEARRAASGTAARSAGNVYLSLGDYAAAEEMFRLAIDKGGVDRDQMLTRLGIAQVQQGKLAEAKATFAQVTGPRTNVARMWTVYIESRA